jgi:hypothetical protein
VYVSEIEKINTKRKMVIISISDMEFFNKVGGQYSSSSNISTIFRSVATKQIQLIADTIFAEPTQIYQIRFPNKDINVRVLNFSTVNFS